MTPEELEEAFKYSEMSRLLACLYDEVGTLQLIAEYENVSSFTYRAHLEDTLEAMYNLEEFVKKEDIV